MRSGWASPLRRSPNANAVRPDAIGWGITYLIKQGCRPSTRSGSGMPAASLQRPQPRRPVGIRAWRVVTVRVFGDVADDPPFCRVGLGLLHNDLIVRGHAMLCPVIRQGLQDPRRTGRNPAMRGAGSALPGTRPLPGLPQRLRCGPLPGLCSCLRRGLERNPHPCQC